MSTAQRAYRIPILTGVLASSGLAVLYLGIVSLAGGPAHALNLLREDRLFVLPILLGFGTQVGLHTRLRLATRHARSQGAMTAAGGGLSTAGMVACCAHHIADVLPILGLSAAATILANRKVPFLVLGLATNLAGIAIAWRALRRLAVGPTAVGAGVAP